MMNNCSHRDADPVLHELGGLPGAEVHHLGEYHRGNKEETETPTQGTRVQSPFQVVNRFRILLLIRTGSVVVELLDPDTNFEYGYGSGFTVTNEL